MLEKWTKLNGFELRAISDRDIPPRAMRVKGLGCKGFDDCIYRDAGRYD